MSRDVRIAIDVGGTFTDVVKLDPLTGSMRFEKVATTPSDPKRGVLDASARAEADLVDVGMFNHGTTLGLGIDPRTGAAWLEATNEAVGFGGHAGGDGEDGIMYLSEPGCRNNPVEVLETKAPMFIESYGYVPDSGGLGRHRGGVGVSRVYRFEADSTGICLVYKTKSAPWPVRGGEPGEAARIVLNPGTDREVVRVAAITTWRRARCSPTSPAVAAASATPSSGSPSEFARTRSTGSSAATRPGSGTASC